MGLPRRPGQTHEPAFVCVVGTRQPPRVTLIDALLAAAVLVGLIVNAVPGWWCAAPLAGWVLVYYGVQEGRAGRHGEDDGGLHHGSHLLR